MSTLTPIGFYGPTGQPLYRIDNAGHADDKAEPIGIVILGADGQPLAGLGGGVGGGAVSIADGADVVQGFTTDAAIVTDVNGTHSGKLRGLVKMLANTWDSTNGALRVYLATGISAAEDTIVNYPFGHNTTVISTATTTVVKPGPGTARKVWVAGGTLGAVTIYNNTAGSGAQFWPGLTPGANAVLMEDQGFDTGLTIVTAAATIIVCSWR